MAPACLRGDFILGESAIIDREIGPARERDESRIEHARGALVVSQIGKDAAGIFEAIASGAVGVIERCRPEGDAVAWIEHFAGAEVVIDNLCIERTDFDRKKRMAHQRLHDLFDAERRRQISRPQPETVLRVIKRREEWQAGYVIDMAMAGKTVG